MSTAILVTSHGLSVEQTLVFWNSLHRSGYEGDVVLFSNDLKVDYQYLDLPAFNIIYKPWVEESPYFRSSRRLFCYLDFLKRSEKQYKTVITSGIRDVLFQKDPEEIEHGRADIFMEHSDPPIARCPYNSMWIRNAYGEEVLGKIGNRNILCAEIMVGTHQGMIGLLEAMTQEAEKHERKHDLEDQAILNYMHYTKQFPDYVMAVHNEQSPVYTVGYLPYIIISKHQILNKAGKVPTIIHQYDRHV